MRFEYCSNKSNRNKQRVNKISILLLFVFKTGKWTETREKTSCGTFWNFSKILVWKSCKFESLRIQFKYSTSNFTGIQSKKALAIKTHSDLVEISNTLGSLVSEALKFLKPRISYYACFAASQLHSLTNQNAEVAVGSK